MRTISQNPYLLLKVNFVIIAASFLRSRKFSVLVTDTDSNSPSRLNISTLVGSAYICLGRNNVSCFTVSLANDSTYNYRTVGFHDSTCPMPGESFIGATSAVNIPSCVARSGTNRGSLVTLYLPPWWGSGMPEVHYRSTPAIGSCLLLAVSGDSGCCWTNRLT